MTQKKKSTHASNMLAVIASVIILPMFVLALAGAIMAILGLLSANEQNLLNVPTILIGVAIFSAFTSILLVFGYRFVIGMYQMLRHYFGLWREKQRIREIQAVNRLREREDTLLTEPNMSSEIAGSKQNLSTFHQIAAGN